MSSSYVLLLPLSCPRSFVCFFSISLSYTADWGELSNACRVCWRSASKSRNQIAIGPHSHIMNGALLSTVGDYGLSDWTLFVLMHRRMYSTIGFVGLPSVLGL